MASRGSAAWWLEHYGKPCTGADIVKLVWHPNLATSRYRGALNVHRGTEPVWQALGAVYLAYNYPFPTSYSGNYSCRPVTGGTNWSGHAWPVANDVNAATNPYVNHAGIRTIKWGVETDMPAAMIREVESITASGIQALRWGGRYRTIKDAMHNELLVTIAEIARGVHAPRGFYIAGHDLPQGETEMSLKNGDSGSAVGKHQEGLLAWNAKALPKFGADKDFGDETELWVKNYQKAADLPQNGIIDGVTSALMLGHLKTAAGKHTHPIAAGKTGESA